MYELISDQSSTTLWAAQPHIFGRPPANTFGPPSSVRGVSWLQAAVAPRLYGGIATPSSYGASVAPSSYGAAISQGSYGAAAASSFYGAAAAPSSYGVPVAPSSYGAPVAPSSYGATVAPISYGAVDIDAALSPGSVFESEMSTSIQSSDQIFESMLQKLDLLWLNMSNKDPDGSQSCFPAPLALPVASPATPQGVLRPTSGLPCSSLYNDKLPVVQPQEQSPPSHQERRSQAQFLPVVQPQRQIPIDDAISTISQKFEDDRMDTVQRLEDDRRTYLAEFVLQDGTSNGTSRFLGSPSQSLAPLANNSNPTLTTQEDPSNKEGPQFGATPARVVLHELVAQLSSFQMETNQHFDRLQESMLKINQGIQHVSTMFSSHGDGLVPISKETGNTRIPNVHSEPSQGCKEIKNIVLEDATSEFLPGLKGIKNIEGAPAHNTQVGQPHDMSFRSHVSSWTIHVFDPGGLHNSTKVLFAKVVQAQFLGVTSLSAQEPSSTTTFVFDPGGCSISTQLEAPSIIINTMYIIWGFLPWRTQTTRSSFWRARMECKGVIHEWHICN